MAYQKPLTTAVLAGGLGTRLRPVLPDTAKCIAPVNGRAFLTFLLDRIVGNSCSDIVLCTGYGAGQVRSQIGECWKRTPVRYSVENSPQGTAGALRLAWESFGNNDPWVVLNGDSLTDCDMSRLTAFHQQSGYAVTVAVVRANDASRFGTIEWQGDRITAFHEKSGRCEPKWVNAGVYVFSPHFFQTLPEHTPLSLEKDVLPEWVAKGAGVFPVPGQLLDIGTPESYATAGILCHV